MQLRVTNSPALRWSAVISVRVVSGHIFSSVLAAGLFFNQTKLHPS